MRVASRPGDRVRRQAMPVVNSILWKPLRDSHYVLTSVKPDQGGFRQILSSSSCSIGSGDGAMDRSEDAFLDSSWAPDWTAR